MLTRTGNTEKRHGRNYDEVVCHCGEVKFVRRDCVALNKSCGCSHVKHKLSYDPCYSTWAGMLNRCNNIKEPNYKHYGGRGIKVCDEWKDITVFKSWLNSVGWQRGLELDRIDNDGDYTPNNCRIVTRQQNVCNTRRSNSPLAGVRKEGERFSARFYRFGKSYYVGMFDTPEEAAEARKMKILEITGEE